MPNDWVMTPELKFGDATQVPVFFRESRAEEPCIDLSGAAWIGPASLVSLASHAQYLSSIGYRPKFVPPADLRISNYVSRMGLGRVLEELDIESRLPQVKANMALNQESLVELQRFSTEKDVSNLIEILVNRDLPQSVLDSLCVALSEMGNNVAQHAKVEFGYMAAQVTDHGENLRFSVADCGIGMLGSLGAHGASSDRQAIAMAISGISGTGLDGRGQGFSAMKSAVASLGGVAHVLSGNALATIRAGQKASYWTYDVPINGTIFDAVIPNVSLS